MEFQRFCYSEFRDYMVYLALLRSERDPNRKEILKRIASQEYEHYLFWRKLSGECITKISRIHIYTILLVRIIFGLTFTLKLLEGHESKTITEYRKVMEKFVEDEHRRELEMLIQDEIEHERYFMNQIDEKILRYTGFIVLGLADSIIEITGVYAGFLGATSSTTVAGIAGLLVGFAASISMAAASYLQAKAQESMKNSPILSALITGLTYIGSVGALSTPYFLLKNILHAFITSVSIAIALTFVFTFYTSIVNEKKFSRELIESVFLILGTGLATYLFGEFLGEIFGIKERILLG
ncbi:MAG: VIT1/CCC1 family protein [Nitrososphaerota archaeon]